MAAAAIPLADRADLWTAALARETDAPIPGGSTLLGERAALNGFRVPGRRSAGGGCRLYDAARGGAVALNLARDDDRALLPALFEDDALDASDDAAVAARIMRRNAASLVARGREMGLALAALDEPPSDGPAVTRLTPPVPRARAPRRPRVLDLSALWAGPLATHLLWLAGADVTKVESPARPDRMREGDPALFARLNQGKASVALDPRDGNGRAQLLRLIARADIVVEAARPRALAGLGIDAAALVRAHPGLVWLTVTAHGAEGQAGGWVGFGDDVGVAAGLSAALRDASGTLGFVGDAIADPLTGIAAARAAWAAWTSGVGGRIGVAMRGVVAMALAESRAADADRFDAQLRRWAAAAGAPFPSVADRPAAPVAAFGADTRACLAALAPC